MTALSRKQQPGILTDSRQVIRGPLICVISLVAFLMVFCRFQVVVLSAYKQLRAQNMNILSDVNEDNYDRAFAFLRPGKQNLLVLQSKLINTSTIKVIQGNAEMGERLYERELQASLDFCLKLFSATSPESHDQLVANPKIGKELLDLTAPIVAPEALERALHVASESDTGDENCPEEESTRIMLEKINSRRVLHQEYNVNGFEAEAFNGFSIRLERGNLGFKKM